VDERGLRRPVATEAVAVVLAFMVAALLTSVPDPPRQAGAEVATGADPVLAELASYDALSLAEASGTFVVGLTVFPPRPGEVQVRLQVAGGETADGALRRGLLRASAAGQSPVSMPLRPCGSGCLAGRGFIPGAAGWRFEASFVSADKYQGRAAFDVPLPAADGRAELERALAATEALRSVRLREELRGEVDGKQVVATYRFAAPDAFEIRVNDSHRVVIGKRTWDSSAPGDAWKEGEWPGEAFRWPKSHYRAFWDERAAVRVLGEEVVDGVPSRVVAFVRPRLPAWFRVWVGIPDGLVRREQMLAEGHLMDRFYDELDRPITITPPVQG